MSDELDKTIRLQRSGKVGTDSRGRTVWTKPVEPVELELVSTQMLKKILDSDDEEQKNRIRELAEGEAGVLARDTRSMDYEIVRDDELEAALKEMNNDEIPAPVAPSIPPDVDEDSEELSLVSTQVLRKLLDVDSGDGPEDTSDEEGPGGHNPYDRG